MAAPIVAGVAAMMRACNPSLTSDDVRRILVETGWSGQGRVTKGLDAYAAVSAAIGGLLPDGAEGNDTLGSAAPLVAMGPGELGTGTRTVASRPSPVVRTSTSGGLIFRCCPRCACRSTGTRRSPG